MKFEYEIPDISELGKKSDLYLSNRFFKGSGPKDHVSYALTVNFVIKLDLAIHAYNEARKAIIEFPKDRQTLQLSLFVKASGYFEQCVESTAGIISTIIGKNGTFIAYGKILLTSTYDSIYQIID